MELLDQIQESFPTFTTRYFSAEWGGIDTNNFDIGSFPNTTTLFWILCRTHQPVIGIKI